MTDIYAVLDYDEKHEVHSALMSCAQQKENTIAGRRYSVAVISKCRHLEATAEMGWLLKQNDKLIGEKVALQTKVKELKKEIETLTQKSAH